MTCSFREAAGKASSCLSFSGVKKGRYSSAKKSDCIRLAKGEEPKGLSILGAKSSLTSSGISYNTSTARDSACSSDSSHTPSPAPGPRPMSTAGTRTRQQVQLYEDIIKQLTEAAVKHSLVTEEFLQSIPEKEAKAMVNLKFYRRLPGLHPQ